MTDQSQVLVQRAVLAFLALVLTAYALTCEWVRAGTGSRQEVITAGDITGLAGALVLLTVLVAALLTTDAFLGRPATRSVAIAFATVSVLVSAGWITMLESAAALALDRFLPETVYRLSFELVATRGSWVALAGSAIALLAALLPNALHWPTTEILTRTLRSPLTWALVGTAVFAFSAALLRNSVWLEGSAAGQSVAMVGWSLPVVGPMSLVGTWFVVVGMAALCFRRQPSGALLCAFGGWLIAFSASMAIVFSDAIARLHLERVGEQYTQALNPEAVLTSVVWWSFALGLLVCAASTISLLPTGTTIGHQ